MVRECKGACYIRGADTAAHRLHALYILASSTLLYLHVLTVCSRELHRAPLRTRVCIVCGGYIGPGQCKHQPGDKYVVKRHRIGARAVKVSTLVGSWGYNRGAERDLATADRYGRKGSSAAWRANARPVTCLGPARPDLHGINVSWHRHRTSVSPGGGCEEGIPSGEIRGV